MGMNLRDYFLEIARTYERRAGTGRGVPAQVLLRHAPEHLSEHVPPAFLVHGSGGSGTATSTPWVGIFDPDETVSPQFGIYVVYLFTTDLASLVLSLMQGITRISREMGGIAKARNRLISDAEAIRRDLPEVSLAGLSTVMDLNPAGQRVKLDNQKGYSAANIASIEYAISSFPSEDALRSDLDRMLALYQDATAVKRRLQLSSPGSIASPSIEVITKVNADPRHRFKPKNDSDYRAVIEGRTLVKSRKHERLVCEYGEWAEERGFVASTPHPRDLVLARGKVEWLVEAKFIRSGNATNAIRAALGQLLTYRHFLYDEPPHGLVGLFSEPVGAAYVAFLDEMGVEVVWWDHGTWLGSESAVSSGLADLR